MCLVWSHNFFRPVGQSFPALGGLSTGGLGRFDILQQGLYASEDVPQLRDPEMREASRKTPPRSAGLRREEAEGAAPGRSLQTRVPPAGELFAGPAQLLLELVLGRRALCHEAQRAERRAEERPARRAGVAAFVQEGRHLEEALWRGGGWVKAQGLRRRLVPAARRHLEAARQG